MFSRRNVGGLDRAARFVLGITLLAGGLFASADRPGYRGVLIGLGLLGLITAAVGFCPPYLLFGFSTARAQPGAPDPLAPAETSRQRAVRLAGRGLAWIFALALAAGLFAVLVVGSRVPLEAVVSTTHPTLSRQACLECHAPIAAEWRQSYHFQSLTGRSWKDVRELGYMKLFDPARKKCVHCHAPANVLDLAGSRSAGAGEEPLGVECTPSLLREPVGVIPAARADDAELGVDCTACHVSERGISGAGRHPTAEHETIADPRFESAARTAETLCRSCHQATVAAWRKTALAAAGTTCLDCHMPATSAPSVVGGPARARRSHTFVADKDPAMLTKAVNAVLAVTADRRARLRIVNDRVGHYLPSGGNWLFVDFTAHDAAGRELKTERVGIGRDEALLLDFWPFARDRRIAFGEQRDLFFGLPEGHGTVEATVRYHDWMRVNPIVATLRERY